MSCNYSLLFFMPLFPNYPVLSSPASSSSLLVSPPPPWSTFTWFLWLYLSPFSTGISSLKVIWCFFDPFWIVFPCLSLLSILIFPLLWVRLSAFTLPYSLFFFSSLSSPFSLTEFEDPLRSYYCLDCAVGREWEWKRNVYSVVRTPFVYLSFLLLLLI